MPSRLRVFFWPRCCFPKSFGKTSVLVLALLLWLLYSYSSYVYEPRRSGGTPTSTEGGPGLALKLVHVESTDENTILRRPTVPLFEGIEETFSTSRGPSGAIDPQHAAAISTVTVTVTTTTTTRTSTTTTTPRTESNKRPPAGPEIDSVQRGNHVVLQNLLRAQKQFGHDDSITLTTHATYELMDNLVELGRHWNGPISVAIYAPATDFSVALRYAIWLRKCYPPVAQLVTFHFVYPKDLPAVTVTTTPPSAALNTTVGPAKLTTNGTSGGPAAYDYIGTVRDMLGSSARRNATAADLPVCRPSPPSPSNYPLPQSFRHRHKLPYPINVCRNVARINAATRFVLASDIELYPSANVIPMFLDFGRRTGLLQVRQKAPSSPLPRAARSVFLASAVDKSPVKVTTLATTTTPLSKSSTVTTTKPKSSRPAAARKVYVLPIFEVDKSIAQTPPSKAQLVELYRRKKAVYFHKHVCSFCNIIPRLNKWLTAPVPKTAKLDLFTTIKRHKPFNRWEPIYIGTNDDPLYDERLTWEGQQDKMTQMYELCLLDYDLAILDNAFLVHRPGIKTTNATEYKVKSPYIAQNNKMYRTIIRELEKKYGANAWCR